MPLSPVCFTAALADLSTSWTSEVLSVQSDLLENNKRATETLFAEKESGEAKQNLTASLVY